MSGHALHRSVLGKAVDKTDRLQQLVASCCAAKPESESNTYDEIHGVCQARVSTLARRDMLPRRGVNERW